VQRFCGSKISAASHPPPPPRPCNTPCWSTAAQPLLGCNLDPGHHPFCSALPCLGRNRDLLPERYPRSTQLKIDLFYDWRLAVNQFVSEPSSLRPTTNIFIFQVNTCGYCPYVTFLTRRWVCRLQLLLGLASAVILGSDSRGTHDHILLSQIRHSPNPEGQVPVFISPMNSVAQIYPRHWVPFRRLLRLAGLRWRYSTPPPHAG
jgi:hypothetical protein